MEGKPSEAVSRYMAEIGRKGGRSKKLSAEQRRLNARRAALGRWRKISDLKPIWEVAADLVAGIPETELRKLPVDGARQLDHYLYSTPKRKRGEVSSRMRATGLPCGERGRLQAN